MARKSLFPRRRPRSPPTRERVLGFALLALLVGLVALFVAAGRGPGPEALPEAEPAASPSRLPLLSPGGWPRGAEETFDAASLYEKIDGKADAYLAYDVVGLTFGGYADPVVPDARYADVYLYDMGTALHAFGMYRSQRTGREAGLDAGDEACDTGLGVFGRRGRWYVEVLPSGPEASGEAAALAAAVLAAMPSDASFAPPDWFPPAGLRILKYDLRSAFGVTDLDDVFTASYDDGQQVFVARFAGEAEARGALGGVRSSFEFLGTPHRLEAEGAYLLGALAAGDGEPRSDLLEAVRRRLREDAR